MFVHMRSVYTFLPLAQATASLKTIIASSSFTWRSSVLRFCQCHTEHTGVRWCHINFDPLRASFSDALYNCGSDLLSMLTCSYWNDYCSVMAVFHFCWVFSMFVCQFYQVEHSVKAMTNYSSNKGGSFDHHERTHQRAPLRTLPTTRATQGHMLRERTFAFQQGQLRVECDRVLLARHCRAVGRLGACIA